MADPVRVSSAPISVGPRPVADRWAGYNQTADGVQRSLVDPVAGTLHRSVGQDPAARATTLESGKITVRRQTALTLSPPKISMGKATKQVTKSTSLASSVQKPRDIDKITCKARPEDNKPRGGGGGSMRKFIPWCS